MTAVCHHLHGEKLMSHAAGTLDPPLLAVLRRHLRFCEDAGRVSAPWIMSAGLSWKGPRRRKTSSSSHGRKYRFPGVLPKKPAVCCLPVAQDLGRSSCRRQFRATGLRRETMDTSWVKPVRPAKICGRSGGFAQTCP